MPENDQSDNSLNAIDELKFINNIIDRICRVRETNHIMSIIIDELIKFTEADQGVINLISEQSKAQPVTVVRKDDKLQKGLPFKVSQQIMGWIINNKRVLKIDDLDSDDRFTSLTSDEGIFKSLLCCPMLVRGNLLGLVTLIRNSDRKPFSDSHGRLAGIVASQSGQVLENTVLLEDLASKNELLEIAQQQLRDENTQLKSELQKTFAFENIVGKSSAMKDVLILTSKVSVHNSPVLITGPTGTGKELIARAIHYNGDRKNQPFIVKNCGVKTESLLEAELFGYVKGAFTGADRDKAGLFKEADKGTVFLDEIGEAPPSIQVAILRVLETGEIKPVGANRTKYVDVRIISATNRDLKEEIEKGTFRQDLYYRLNTFTIDLPALVRRKDDIPLLTHHFLKKLSAKTGRENISISPAAIEKLVNYTWPGNVRQLENVLERALIVSEDDIIDIDDLSHEILDLTKEVTELSSLEGRLRDVVEDVEKNLILKTLDRNNGNILKTSRILGLTRKGLKDKMIRYGIKSSKD